MNIVRLCTCFLRGDAPRVCSHIEVQETKPGEPQYRDRAALEQAASLLGCEILDQKTYTWFGESLGDYQIPRGMKKSELGKNAEFILRIKEPKYSQLRDRHKETPYDVGFIEDKNNPGCYVPMYDYFLGGYGIDELLGEAARDKHGKIQCLLPKLKQAYDMVCERLAAAAVGDNIEFLTLAQAHARFPKVFQQAEPADTWVSIATTERRIGVK